MTDARTSRVTAELVLFVALSFLGSWLVATTLRVFELNVAPGPIGTRLFTTSLLYAVTMGWQPLLATWVVLRWINPRDPLDLALRPCPHVFSFVGVIVALVFAGAAMALASVAVATGLIAPALLNGSPEAELAVNTGNIGAFLLAFAGTLVLVWVQAFAEEVGWRGYFLSRSMERFGRWRGLVLQGAVWGLWYAPVLFFSTYGPMGTFDSFMRSLGFVVTCMLLGILLGWLRLASRSLVPAVTANTTLTLMAGLPYVIHGVDAGLRSAIFGPLGWLVLAAGIGVLLASRWRAVVRVPEHISNHSGTPPMMRGWVVLDGRVTHDRTLH